MKCSCDATADANPTYSRVQRYFDAMSSPGIFLYPLAIDPCSKHI
jgi:hypothetical protein